MKQPHMRGTSGVMPSFYKTGSGGAHLMLICIPTKKEMCMIVVLYVDDLIMILNHEEKFLQTKDTLSGEFEMIDLELMCFCLGIEVW